MISYAFAIADIRPDEPSIMAGFAAQTKPVKDINSTLDARILALDDTQKTILLISADSLAMSEKMTIQLTKYATALFHKESHVVLCCTHTHFAPTILNEHYANLVYTRITEAMHTLTFMQADLSFTYQKVFFDEVGKSRNTGMPSDSIFLYLVTIYAQNKRIASLITYNCHPTILSEHNTFMSSEYPGLLIKKLKDDYPNEFFTFFQSAAGDISTRFTRTTQDEAGMEEMTNRLYHKVLILRNTASKQYSFNSISFQSILLPITRDLSPLDLSRIPSSLSSREKQVFEEGLAAVEKLRSDPKILHMLGDHMLVSEVSLGQLHMVFVPAELFSSYIHALNPDHMNILVCYTNGYQPYMPGPDFHALTYETMLDTTDQETKKKLMHLIHELS